MGLGGSLVFGAFGRFFSPTGNNAAKDCDGGLAGALAGPRRDNNAQELCDPMSVCPQRLLTMTEN